MSKKLLSILFLVIATSFILSGCESIDKNQKIINHRTLPGHTFDKYSSTSSSYDNKTSITTSRNGVIVYKDNTLYDNTHSNASSTDVGFGPNAIRFGPGGN